MRLEDRIRNELHDTAERLALDPGEYRRAIETARRRRQRRIISALSGMVVVAGLVVIVLALRPGSEVVVSPSTTGPSTPTTAAPASPPPPPDLPTSQLPPEHLPPRRRHNRRSHITPTADSPPAKRMALPAAETGRPPGGGKGRPSCLGVVWRGRRHLQRGCRGQSPPASARSAQLPPSAQLRQGGAGAEPACMRPQRPAAAHRAGAPTALPGASPDVAHALGPAGPLQP